MQRMPANFTSNWLGYLAFLNGAVTRHSGRAMRDIQRRQYSFDRLLNDTLGFWSDAASGWWTAMRGTDCAVPTMLFDITQYTQTATRTLPLFGPSLPYGSPRLVFLRMLWGDGPGTVIRRRNVRMRIVLGGSELKVSLVNLVWPVGDTPIDARPERPTSPLPTTLKIAVYEGLIALRSEPLAHMYIQVNPDVHLAHESEELTAPAEETPEETEPTQQSSKRRARADDQRRRRNRRASRQR